MAYANSGSGGRGKPYWIREAAVNPEEMVATDSPSGQQSQPGKWAQPRSKRWPKPGSGKSGSYALRIVGSLAVVLVLAIFVFVAGCGQQAAAKSRVVFALESEPERLDPLTIKNPQTFRVAWQIYEGLLGLSENGQIEPRLAQSWHTTDYQTWTFKLRENAAFHTSELFGSGGKARNVTADDVVWSYTAFCSPNAYASFVLTDSLKGCADYNAGKSASVTGIRAVDSHTVELQLIHPEAFFLNRISSPWLAVFPKESSESAFKDRWGLELAVGTGPFHLVSRSDTEIVLEKNPDYWDKNRVPTIDNLVFRVIKNSQVRLAELFNGNIDIMPLSSQLFSTVLDTNGQLKEQYRQSLSLKVFPTFNHHLIGFNLKQVPDAHLRRAMSLGTDREQIVNTLLASFADVTGGAIPPAMRGYTPLIEKPLYQPDKAREELRQSSYRGEPLEMLVHDLANSERVGEIFQQQMKDIGVTIKLTKIDYGSLIGRVIKGEAPLFNLFAEIVFSSPEPLLINLFDTDKIPVPNFWRYSNHKVDTELNSLGGITSEKERLTLSARIEKQIVADVPAIFLYSEKHVLIHLQRVTHIIVNPNEHFQLEQARLVQ